jgi:hypothetical protein
VEDGLGEWFDIIQRCEAGINLLCVDVLQSAMIVAIVRGWVDPSTPNVYMRLIGTICHVGRHLDLVACARVSCPKKGTAGLAV